MQVLANIFSCGDVGDSGAAALLSLILRSMGTGLTGTRSSSLAPADVTSNGERMTSKGEEGVP